MTLVQQINELKIIMGSNPIIVTEDYAYFLEEDILENLQGLS